MKIRLQHWAQILPIILLISLISFNPVFAAGSFFDTIQQSGNGGVAKEGELSPSDTDSETQPILSSNDEIQFLQAVKLTAAQTKVIISSVIAQILKTNHVNLGAKINTVYLPPEGSAKPAPSPVASGTAKPGSTNTGGVNTGGAINAGGIIRPPSSGGSTSGTGNTGNTGTVKPPYTPPVASGAVGLRAEMITKFGITPVDGESKWTDQQLSNALKVLAQLPAHFRAATTTIRRDKTYQGNTRVLGYVKMGIPTVYLLDGAAQSPAVFQRTLAHEMTHCFQARNTGIARKWDSTFWAGGKPKTSSVTSYGNSQSMEDMAESVAVYFTNGKSMKSTHPTRYEFIKTNVMGGIEF